MLEELSMVTYGLILFDFSRDFYKIGKIVSFRYISSTYLSVFLRLSELGYHVGIRMLDLIFIREKGLRRETKLLNILLFIKSNVWKVKLISL